MVIIDCHGHCSIDGSHFQAVDEVIDTLDLYGVDKICCSSPLMTSFAPPDEVRRCNDLVLASMQRYPDRVLGMCFINPGYFQASQDEINRCVVDGGMSGIKLYHQYRIDEPVQFPVLERSIELGVPVLMHAGWLNDPETRARQPRISSGCHFAEAARRYPEAILICGHIGGGGDWERQIKSLRSAPSVYLDTGGSVMDAGMIDRCVREIGVKRLLFACDMSMERGLGKIMDAALNARDRKRILGDNFLDILGRRRI